MNESNIRQLIDGVKSHKMSRKDFIRLMVGVGLTAPIASQLLTHAGVAQAAGKPDYAPTKRGGGGALKLLWWQGATLLNPHFAVGTKDMEGSRIFYEPLAAYDADGGLVPILAAEIPSVANGGVAADGKSVTWKLKKGVKWHDGKPFSADDVVFTAAYAANPATSSVSIGSYKDRKFIKVDDYTVRVEFPEPTPFWADPYCGIYGCIIPKHLFEAFAGEKSREAPVNLAPVGTGPYKFVEFKPGDMVKGAINMDYHEDNRPHFDTIEMKGGGDAPSAARAVLQTGEYDYAWNLQVEDEVLKRFEQGGKGALHLSWGGNLEFIQLNQTDPLKEVDGERSSLKAPHPILTDPKVRDALALLVDKDSMQKFIYGRTARATSNYENGPAQFASKNTKSEFDIEKAKKLLDEAGWKPGADGIRMKDGKPLKLQFQTSINGPRQKCQQIIKGACQKAGVDIDLKQVTASVFFSSDPGNDDIYIKFYCDMQMYTTTQQQPDPERFMDQYVSTNAGSKANKWQGRNTVRYVNLEYDRLYALAQHELDPFKRAALYIQMNDMVCNSHCIIPILHRPMVSGIASNLRVTPTGWDNDLAILKDWYRVA
jgi:peptide/nickel transport system substrate-binding protein